MVQAEQLGGLDLGAFGFLQGLGDEGHSIAEISIGWKFASGAISHTFCEVSHLPFHSLQGSWALAHRQTLFLWHGQSSA